MKKIENSTILITGGAGFIGSYVARLLLENRCSVRILDNLSSGKTSNIPTGAEFINGDIRCTDTVLKAVKHVDHVIHLAAQVSVPYSVENPLKSFDINANGTATVLDALRETGFNGRFIYASSAAVYGDSTEKLTEEATLGNPLSPYAQEKIFNESSAKLYSNLYGINTVGLRFFNVYGKGQVIGSSYAGVLTIFVDNLKQNKPLTIFGKGDQSRDFVFVNDVAKVIVNALIANNTPAIMNVASGVSTNLNEIIKILAEIIGVEPIINYKDRRSGDILYSSANNALMAKNFPLLNPLCIKTGLKEMLK